MELVPFLNKWADSGTKLDVKAIYRRPGSGITLTSPLPVRRHNDWAAKGFQYVCLATLEDLGHVASELRANGHDPIAMKSCYDRNGNFDVPKYVKIAKADDETYLSDLQAKVDKFGAEAVVEMMRVADPAFVLPASITTERIFNKGGIVAQPDEAIPVVIPEDGTKVFAGVKGKGK